jgi:hypothetical protein
MKWFMFVFSAMASGAVAASSLPPVLRAAGCSYFLILSAILAIAIYGKE